MTTEPITLRLDQLGDAVEAVPYLLGFTPRRSLVAVALRGPRERMSFTMRLDLLPPEYDAKVATTVAHRMAAAEAESVMVFVYPGRRPSIGKPLPRRRLVDAIERAVDVPMREAVLVTRERMWSYVCDDSRCCPPEGRRRPVNSPGQLALEAAHALNGRALLDDREAVVASIQPVTGAAAQAMSGSIDAVTTAYIGTTPEGFRKTARELAEELRGRYADRPGLTDREAAVVIVGLHDIALRDEVLGWLAAHEEPMRLLLHDLARRALPPLDAPVCTMLAWAAYMSGDGLIASIALERARESDPEYPLARLLDDALIAQLPPTELRRALSAFTERT